MIRELRISFVVILLVPLLVNCASDPSCDSKQEISNKIVPCERFKKFRVNQFGHTVQSLCFMEKKTKILTPGYQIVAKRFEHVVGIIFDYNRKIFYLPEKIERKFPNLQGISAQNCTLKMISKVNFAKLPSLSVLLLAGNKITAIAADTFRDNINLMYIDLRDNQIQFICENAFDHLNSLVRTQVLLEGNICINESFTLYGWNHENYDDLAKAIQGNCTNFT